MTDAAQRDFRGILRWSMERFGESQARVYAKTVSLAIQALEAGPSVAGAKARDDIAKGICCLHVARQGRQGRHFVMFRVASRQERRLDVLRLLHDAMDLSRHIAGG